MWSRKPASLAATSVMALFAAEAAWADITPRGRLHLDHAVHNEDGRALGDGFHVRRARLGLSGTINPGSEGVESDWAYMIEYDFAEDGVAARDVYLRYTGLPVGNITIGQFKVPFGLEELTSSNNISLIERSLPTTTFAQARRLGVGFTTSGDQWQWQLMAFGQGSGDASRDTDGDEGRGVGTRVVFNPINGNGNVLHLGVAGSLEQPADRALEQARFRTRPESRPSSVRLVDTGVLDGVRNINQVGVEAGWASGPFSLQGEWMGVGVSRRAESSLSFDGWYVSASWVLTGESRGYRDGVFRGVTPRNGGNGAWELTARVSDVDLDDGPIAGGTQRNYTLGVNWYANSNVRFMANYIFVDSERQGVSEDPGILLLRTQVSF